MNARRPPTFCADLGPSVGSSEEGQQMSADQLLGSMGSPAYPLFSYWNVGIYGTARLIPSGYFAQPTANVAMESSEDEPSFQLPVLICAGTAADRRLPVTYYLCLDKGDAVE